MGSSRDAYSGAGTGARAGARAGTRSLREAAETGGFPYRCVARRSPGESVFVARCPAWPGLSAHGETWFESVENLYVTGAAMVDARRLMGRPIPSSDLPPIADDADHQACLRRIQELWDSEEGTPAGDELEAFLLAVETYESMRFVFESGLDEEITPPGGMPAGGP